MSECGLMLLPMALVADESVARLLDSDWPKAEIVSPPRLHAILSEGAYRWWISRAKPPGDDKPADATCP